MKIHEKNPFRGSFLTVAVISCIVLSIVFYYISYTGNKAIEEKYNKEKVEACMEELEVQLQLMKEVALHIVSNYKFWPSYFNENLSREFSMLEQFTKYKYYNLLSDEYFLDYGESGFYTSEGQMSTLEAFLQNKSKNSEEKQRFMDELQRQREGLERICGAPKMIAIFDDIYVLVPFRMNGGSEQDNVILGYRVKTDVLENRFQIASGEINGEITLYGEDGVLYSNHQQPVLEQQKDVITTVSKNGLYTFCYLPEKGFNLQNSLFFLYLLLILIDATLVLMVADIFAEKTYKPIRVLAETYRGEVLTKRNDHENALEELRFIMDKMLLNTRESSLQIQENQRIFRNQVLKMIMEGSISEELQYYLEKAQIDLPGPLYCVVSIAFEKEEGVTGEVIKWLQEEVERIPDEKERVYVICNMENRLLNVICSIYSEEGKEEFLETVCDVAESFGYDPLIGIGNAYQELRQLFASWMESMDAIQCKKEKNEKEEKGGFIYQAEDVRRIMSALENGSEEVSLERLKDFVKKLELQPLSMLMLQYILSDFLGEIRKLCERYHMEISRQSASLLISTKNVQDFEHASKKVIREFCKAYEGIRNQVKGDEAKKICTYIEEHFMEYDISSESVAAYFHVSTDAVRQAVMLHTGKLYRDYLIYLRIEYAKVLLCKEDIPVAELCQKVGYGNVSYFIKLFREYTGVTPAKYRNNAVNK